MKKKYRVIFRPKFINYHAIEDNYGNILPMPFADYTYHKYDKFCSDNSKDTERYGHYN